MHRGLITDPTLMMEFMLAGRAIFTIKSKKSGKHYTYKVTRARDKGEQKSALRWWVGILTGGDNSTDFAKLGQIVAYHEGYPRFSLVRGTKFRKESPPAAGFEYVLAGIVYGNDAALNSFEFYHEGRCGACGRRLTDPDSIRRGLGPVCAGRK